MGNNIKKRLYGLDLLRIYSTFVILLYHLPLGQKAPEESPFYYLIRQNGAVVMVLFFMMSGFSLFYNYGEEDFTDYNKIRHFYKKRFWAIFPLYLIYLLLWYCSYGLEWDLKTIIITFPLAITGTTSVFYGVRAYTFGTGSWFLSYLFAYYLITPLAIIVIKNNKRTLKCAIVFLYILCALGTLTLYWYGYDRTIGYWSLGLRFLQFLIGMNLGALFVSGKNSISKGYACLLILISIGTYVYVSGVWGFPSFFSEWYIIPVNVILIWVIAGFEETDLVYKIAESVVVQKMTKLTFGIYLMQEFAQFMLEKMFEVTENSHPWFAWNVLCKHYRLLYIAITLFLSIIATFFAEKVRIRATRERIKTE